VHVVQIDVVGSQPRQRFSQLLAQEVLLTRDLEASEQIIYHQTLVVVVFDLGTQCAHLSCRRHAELGADYELFSSVNLDCLSNYLFVVVNLRSISARALYRGGTKYSMSALWPIS
jgi:hypothetical protein